MTQKPDDISGKQAAYYGGLYEKHGASVDAVASGLQVYKNLRYEKLSAVFARDSSCSVHDVGFGLGHYHEFIKSAYPDKSVDYSGSEVTPHFVEHCRQVYPDGAFFLRDLSTSPSPERYDYFIFGGTFYHLAGSAPHDFQQFMERMLSNAFASADRGIAFNVITGYSDFRSEDLFYADLPAVLEFVVGKLSRFFTIDHAAPLYEYTVCVYREEYISRVHPDAAYNKYFKTRR